MTTLTIFDKGHHACAPIGYEFLRIRRKNIDGCKLSIVEEV